MEAYLGFSIVVLFITFGSLIGHGVNKKETSEIIIGILGAIVLGTMFVCAISEHQEPKAMEVYQGKTTLEYRVKDGVVVDSVVVYKDERSR